MTKWTHRHVIDLSNFSLEDYRSVLELANRFNSIPKTGARKLPALQGRLVTNLFFEPSTRTRSSFELAARNLSADVQNFSINTSSQSKGESAIDTAFTYVAMGADVLVVRHSCAGIPEQLAKALENKGISTAVLNAGDGLHSHPSQGLLDLFTLANYFNPGNPVPESLAKKEIVIVGDILHSRVARSNIWALTGCGANVTLCGPESLLPEDFSSFINSPPPGQEIDPIQKRGNIKIIRSLKESLQDADAVMTLRLQKERMQQNLLTDLNSYYLEYGITHECLKWCKQRIPVLHPGPVNRGIEMSSALLNDKSITLIDKQVKNGIPVRMALLYLLTSIESMDKINNFRH